MFSRLWRWVVPKQAAPQALVAAPAQLDSVQTVHDSELSPANSNAGTAESVRPQSFLEELALEHAPAANFQSDAEPRIAQLVLQAVNYLQTKKLDPPVVPALVPRVLAIVNEPEVDATRLTHVIQQDLALSAKLLSVANSPLFGGAVEVKSVRQAVAHMGSEQVAQIAIGLACRSNLEGASDSPFARRWQRLFAHGMSCAFSAAQFVGRGDRAEQEAAFLGGLFHDVAKAVALRAIEAMVESGKLSMSDLPDEVIDEALQRIHAYPGAEFYEKWTLPSELMELCADHHQLESVDPNKRVFHVVSLCSSFDSLQRGDLAERRDALEEARTCCERLRLDERTARKLYNDTRLRGEQTTRLFS